jgi:hypothetical protein
VLTGGIDVVRLGDVCDEANEAKCRVRRRIHVLQLQRLEPLAEDVRLRRPKPDGQSLESRLIRIGQVHLRGLTHTFLGPWLIMTISHDSRL